MKHGMGELEVVVTKLVSLTPGFRKSFKIAGQNLLAIKIKITKIHA